MESTIKQREAVSEAVKRCAVAVASLGVDSYESIAFATIQKLLTDAFGMKKESDTPDASTGETERLAAVNEAFVRCLQAQEQLIQNGKGQSAMSREFDIIGATLLEAFELDKAQAQTEECMPYAHVWQATETAAKTVATIAEGMRKDGKRDGIRVDTDIAMAEVLHLLVAIESMFPLHIRALRVDNIELRHSYPTAAQGAIPILLWCPNCGERHIDDSDRKAHKTHACQRCGLLWRPCIEATHGVQFLPGCKDAYP